MSKSIESKYKRSDWAYVKESLEKEWIPKVVIAFRTPQEIWEITKCQKNMIALQVAAQILWYLKGKEIPTINKMIKRLEVEEDPIFELLELSRSFDRRTIRNWISPIFPISERWRKMKADHPDRDRQFKELRPIPDIHAENEICMGKLLFATFCVTRILKLLDWDESQIIHSKSINCLWAPVSQFVRKKYLKHWVSEAYLSNGRIFDL